MNERRCEQVGQVGKRQAQDIDAPREGAQATFCFDDERKKARQVCSVCSNHAATGLKRGDTCDCGRRFWERYNGKNEWRSQAAFERACLRRKTYTAKYGKLNRQKLTAIKRQWRADNPNKVSALKKRDYQKNRAKRIAAIKAWGVKNRERVNASKRRLSKTDNYKIRAKNWLSRPHARVAHNQRKRLARAALGRFCKPSTFDALGCSGEFLKFWLESKWKPGMSWENYGKTGWHIDHIRPLASFDLTQEKEQKLAFHFLNLQPLWAHENLSKSDKY